MGIKSFIRFHRFSLVRRVMSRLSMGLGILLIVAILLSFTDIPFWAYYWLGTHNADLEPKPNLIVLMGGGGMPSADGLMRCYSAADIADEALKAKIIIAIPRDTALLDDSPERMMAKELVMRGTDSTRFIFEPHGSNTISQAQNIRAMFDSLSMDTLAIRLVTSPEHMLRSVMVFRNVGFQNVGGQPAFGRDIPEDLLKKESLSDNKKPPAGVGLRYNMWNYLKYEITVLRELCAIIYYWLRGWI